jgi:hypothetical protein
MTVCACVRVRLTVCAFVCQGTLCDDLEALSEVIDKTGGRSKAAPNSYDGRNIMTLAMMVVMVMTMVLMMTMKVMVMMTIVMIMMVIMVMMLMVHLVLRHLSTLTPL